MSLSLFEREKVARKEDLLASPGGAAELSVVAVENDFVERVYEKLAVFYDLAFGPALQPGRRRAIARLALEPGHRVLEVGVGTGVNVDLYSAGCPVVGIDLSEPMLEQARARVARRGT